MITPQALSGAPKRRSSLSWVRWGASFATLAATLLPPACGPQASGTKTNWYASCDATADCDDELACICNVCTTTCESDDACGEGQCDSSLRTAAYCEGADEPPATSERLCLPDPEPETCEEVPFPDDGVLDDAVEPDCDIPGALICESFDAPLPEHYATWRADDGAAAVTDCDAYAGEGSAHYTGTDRGTVQTRMRLPAPIASGSLYSRFFLHLGDSTVLDEQHILLELWHKEEGENSERTTLFLDGERRMTVFVGSEPLSYPAAEMTPVPIGEWVCIELAVDVDAADGRVRLSLDGETVVDETGMDTLPEDNFEFVVLESLAGPGSTGNVIDTYIDELVIGTEPIGCE